MSVPLTPEQQAQRDALDASLAARTVDDLLESIWRLVDAADQDSIEALCEVMRRANERDEARRQLRAEQDAARRVVTRLHEALGEYEGSYLDAACEAIGKWRAFVAKGMEVAARINSSFASERVVSEPGSGITITALTLTPEAGVRLTTNGATLPPTTEKP